MKFGDDPLSCIAKTKVTLAQFTCKISQYSPKNFLKFLSKTCNFIKKEIPKQVFSCEYCEIFKNTYFEEHLRTVVSKCKGLLGL